jgi:NADPH-dependent 2,4-dienoyl-CoA reductase/sulfur reductase-like enzyme
LVKRIQRAGCHLPFLERGPAQKQFAGCEPKWLRLALTGVKKRVIIVGGVAGGASAAARLRRLDENAEIVIFERGAFVSLANCGLPYRVGGVITDERKLLVATPELLRDRFRIEVHTEHEVTAIDRATHTVTVRNLSDGSERQEHYDALLLSPGAGPIRPPIPGIDLPGVFTVVSRNNSVRSV